MLKIVKGVALIGVLTIALIGLAAPVQPALAGTIILEGSDAIGFHSGCGVCDAQAYRDQTWKAIGGSDPRTIAVIGHEPVSAGIIGSGTHPITRFETTADAIAAGGLGNYVALYFLATGGCCTEDDTLPAGHEAEISAYLAAGGTVMIENYTGSAAWDFAVGAGGAGNAHVAGVGGGLPSSLSCDDGETVTPTGLANGFTQPAPMGCWTHQAYDQNFFGPLGFNLSFFDSPTDIGLTGPFSSLLSSGRTVTGAPEPASLVLLGLGLAGLAAIARRRRQA